MRPDLKYRLFPTEASFDGKAIEARFIPYNEVATVVDEERGRLVKYREGFDPGVFAKQVSTSEPGNLNRIVMRHLHDAAYGLGYLGQVASLQDGSDGLYGAVPIIKSRQGDVAELLEQGVDSISIEFHELRNGTAMRDGVRWRTNAHLFALALEPVGAYRNAKVLAYRGGDIDPDDVDDADEELDEEARAEAERVAADALAADEHAAEERHERAAAHELWLAEQLEAQTKLNERYGIESAQI